MDDNIYSWQNVVPDKFDENLDIVCTSGIHYFKSVELAFY